MPVDMFVIRHLLQMIFFSELDKHLLYIIRNNTVTKHFDEDPFSCK